MQHVGDRHFLDRRLDPLRSGDVSAEYCLHPIIHRHTWNEYCSANSAWKRLKSYFSGHQWNVHTLYNHWMRIVWSKIWKLLIKCINCMIKHNKPIACSYRVLRKNVTPPATGSGPCATMAPYIQVKSLARGAHVPCIFWLTEDHSWDWPVEMTVISHLEFEKTLFLGFISPLMSLFL